ncbi:hypothetical protein GCM10009624_27860 [Gordonia sinesedis]
MTITIEGVKPGAQLLDEIAENGTEVMLNFSRGKDSLTVWLELERRGIRPTAVVHNSPMPGLKWIADDLKRYEDLFGQHIYNMPTAAFTSLLAGNVDQPPERCAMLEALDLPPKVTSAEWDELMRAAFGTKDSWMLSGERASDSHNRRMAIKSHGPISEKGRRIKPIWDFQIGDVRRVLREGGIPVLPDGTKALNGSNVSGLPDSLDYRLWGRSFDAIRWDFIKDLPEYAPDDWEMMLRWLPLLRAELKRGEVLYGQG